MNNKGLIAAVLVIVLGIVIVAAVIMFSKRRVAMRPVVQKTGGGNAWSNVGSLLGGLSGGLISSWKPGSGQPSVGGKQVTTQTGDSLWQGVPRSTYPTLSPTAMYPTGGYAMPAPDISGADLMNINSGAQGGQSLNELAASGKWNPETGEINWG